MTLAASATASGCSAPEALVLSADRQIVRESNGSYRVSDGWMQERYQLERALRLQLERCDAAATERTK